MFGGIPFGFSPDGMGGMGGPPGPREPADTTKLYEALGVEKDATEAQIRKAYKKRALRTHPDRGGDPEEFKLVQKAYEVLGDAEKRALYDKYGEEGLDKPPPPEGGDDLMSMLFGGGRGRGRGGPRKGDDITHRLTVSLEELYNGRTHKLALTKDVLCEVCGGRGCKEGGSMSVCQDCDGRGMKIHLRAIGPGMMQRVRAPCDSCSGSGQSIPASDRCPACSGRKVKSVKKRLEITVEKGMRNGQKIVLAGEADQAPGMEPGDVVFVVQQKEHDVYKRRGQDLVMEKKISLVEALTGTTFTVQTLDAEGRKVVVHTAPGEILKTDDIKAVPNEGMPYYGRAYERGMLLIKFTVEFPDALDDAARAALTRVLPTALPPHEGADVDVDREPRTREEAAKIASGHAARAEAEFISRVAADADDDADAAADDSLEFAVLSDFDPEAEMKFGRMGASGPGSAYDEDEGGAGMHGQRVQCQTA